MNNLATMLRDTADLMPNAEQIARWRKALFETGAMTLEGRGMVGGELADLYNWLARIDNEASRVRISGPTTLYDWWNHDQQAEDVV